MSIKLSVSLLVGLLVFMICLPNTIKLPATHEGEQNQWHNLIKADYGQLRDFSNNQNLFGLNQEQFEDLLWKGLLKAIDFHQSPKHLNAAQANKWIKTQFTANSNLQHQLPRPKIVAATKSKAFEAYTNFQGFWHGRWKSVQVHHHWLPVREHYRKISENEFLLGFQSCYTGDGIGWNYVVEKEGEIVLLGFVYHMTSEGSIAFGNPHYAFLNSGGQLIWVSDDHIYYEFTCTNPRCENGKHYVITGGGYEDKNKKPVLVSGFQAIYLSQKLQLPKFEVLALATYDEKENRFLESRVAPTTESLEATIPGTEYVNETLRKALNKISKLNSIPKLLQKIW